MRKTKIDWCDSTWNPVTGCLAQCTYCYARNIANRFGANWETSTNKLPELAERVYGHRPGKNGKPETKAEPYPYNFTPTLHKYRLNDYINTQNKNIFVCSMADLFGDWVPDEWIEEVFAACKAAPQHNYLFLTKNPQRYLELYSVGKLPRGDNMWYGATVTNIKQLEEVANAFCEIPCGFKLFLSIEPLLEDISWADAWYDICKGRYVDRVIIGAETGNRKTKVVPNRSWITPIYFDCDEPGESILPIPVFMKDSLAEFWKEPLVQEFPPELQKTGEH